MEGVGEDWAELVELIVEIEEVIGGAVGVVEFGAEADLAVEATGEAGAGLEVDAIACVVAEVGRAHGEKACGPVVGKGVLVHPVEAEGLRAIVVAEGQVEAKAGAVGGLALGEFPEEFGLKEIEVEIGAVGISSAYDGAPHEVVVEGLFVVDAMGVVVAIGVESEAVLEGGVVVVDDGSEDAAGVLGLEGGASEKSGENERCFHGCEGFCVEWVAQFWEGANDFGGGLRLLNLRELGRISVISGWGLGPVFLGWVVVCGFC